MANASILAAFERMWQHIVAKLGDKADISHTHDEFESLQTSVDENAAALNTEISRIDTLVASQGSGATKSTTVSGYMGNITAEVNESLCSCKFISDGVHVFVEISVVGSEPCISPGISNILCTIPEGYEPLGDHELPYIHSNYPELRFFVGQAATEDGAIAWHVKYRNFSDTAYNFTPAYLYLQYAVADPYLPEVNDIRVGYDGTIYESAGTAVREQIQQILVNGSGSGTGVSVDTTLSISGAAADAKTVGDKFVELEEKVNSGVTVSDDGNGNIVFETVTSNMSVEDDGDGNITIC